MRLWALGEKPGQRKGSEFSDLRESTEPCASAVSAGLGPDRRGAPRLRSSVALSKLLNISESIFSFVGWV